LEEEMLFKDPSAAPQSKTVNSEDELTHLREMVKKL
jgi:hypothetical protein